MIQNRVRFAWQLLGLAAFYVVAIPPVLAQVSQSTVRPAVALHHGVRWVDPNASSPTGFAAPAGAHLGYYGGPIISNVEVIQVLYGSGSYNAQVAGLTSPTMGDFFSDFTNSGLISLLQQYNTTPYHNPFLSNGVGQNFENGTFGGLFQIIPSAAHNGSTITDAQIQAELLAQISTGHLPAPVLDASGYPNTLYMIYFPPGKTITHAGETSCVPNSFCAYHGTTVNVFSGQHILYGVMPDMQAGSGCSVGCGGSTVFGNYTSITSHELVEAMTDADIGIATTVGLPLAWYDSNYGEIGDICNGQQASYVANGTTYTIQLEFSNSANNCVLPPATSTGNPFVYRIPRDQQLACYGISVAPNFPSNCDDITNPDDKQMCFGLSMNSQTPCTSIQDRNLQLACYGMSVRPSFPSNCRDITDAQLKAFCYGVSSNGTAPSPNCNNLTDNNARSECLGIALHNSSYCSSITNTNDRLFCQGIANRSQTPCTSIH